MADARHSLGRAGEDLAVAHLERAGFAILARNERAAGVELDVVAFDGRTLVFAEVKTLSAAAVRGSGLLPLDRLAHRQRKRLRRGAAAWLRAHPDHPRAAHLRFDAIGIVLDTRRRLVRLDHIENAW